MVMWGERFGWTGTYWFEMGETVSWKVAPPPPSSEAPQSNNTHVTGKANKITSPLFILQRRWIKKLEINNSRSGQIIKILALFSCSQAVMGTSFKLTSNHRVRGFSVCCDVTTMTVNMLNQLVINIFSVWESVNWMSRHLTFKSCLSCRENLLWPFCVITWYDSSWQEVWISVLLRSWPWLTLRSFHIWWLKCYHVKCTVLHNMYIFS
jgi:hypothetical protein